MVTCGTCLMWSAVGEGVSNPLAKGISWDNAKPGAAQYYSFKIVEMKLKFNKK